MRPRYATLVGRLYMSTWTIFRICCESTAARWRLWHHRSFAARHKSRQPMPKSQNLRGMLSMLLAVATFSLMDACLKVLAPHYAPMQVAALRGMSSWPLVAAWVLYDGGPRQLLRVRWPLHLLRGVLSIFMLASFAYALRTLPLAETY